MKALWSILAAIALALCLPAGAETPQQAFGVSVVGDSANCGTSPVGLRCTNLGAYPYILVAGYYAKGDGGGGYFAQGAPGCTDNGGTILKDSAGDCFYRQDPRAAVPVNWFGAKCDAVTTVVGGSITKGSTQFTSAGPVFQPGDEGKVFEIFYRSNAPFRTTIRKYDSSTQVELVTPSPHDYPDPVGVGATGATFNPVVDQGLDDAGSGYEPGDTLSVQGGGATVQAQLAVNGTGLVAFSQPTGGGGQGYQVNDLISFYADPNFLTVQPATIQVTSIDNNGAVTGFGWVSNGDYEPALGGSANPTSLDARGGSGSGYTISLDANDGSFGIADITLGEGGAYTRLPPIPSALSNTRGGDPASVDLTFPTPGWTYGTDDTAALQALESWLETDADRGIYNAAEVPGDRTCLLQTLKINRAVTWRSSGSSQAQLLQILGSTGSTVDSTHYGFILVAANYPADDQYQNVGLGQTPVGFENIQIAGADTGPTANVDGTQTTCSLTAEPYCNDGLLYQNPAQATRSAVNGVLKNVQVVNFPGNNLAVWHFSGELRGYNVFAGNAGGNCVDIEHTANPYRFYQLSGGNCTIGLNLVRTRSEEFHGMSFWNNQKNVSVTGTLGVPESYILFDGIQLGPAKGENLYLDQQNEVVLCAANCFLKDANTDHTVGTDGDAAVAIGPDAATTANGLSPIIAQLDQGVMAEPHINKAGSDILFLLSPAKTPCTCRVALGSGMLDVTANGGAPTTNDTTRLTGQTTYAPPTFANAATIGTPPKALTLNPNELGIGVSTDSVTEPGAGGLKLRVECGSKSGTAKIVAMAGDLSTETVISDNIGGGVGGKCGG